MTDANQDDVAQRTVAILMAVALFLVPAFARTSHAEVLPPVTTAPAAGPGVSEPAELLVGSTGILCYTEPCPWMGIMVVEDVGDVPGHLLWWGTDLPPFEAPGEIVARIADAWNNHGCLVVMGQLLHDIFMVSDIVGEC